MNGEKIKVTSRALTSFKNLNLDGKPTRDSELASEVYDFISGSGFAGVRYEWDSFVNDILSGVKPDGQIFGYVENTSISSLPRALRPSKVFEPGLGQIRSHARTRPISR